MEVTEEHIVSFANMARTLTVKPDMWSQTLDGSPCVLARLKDGIIARLVLRELSEDPGDAIFLVSLWNNSQTEDGCCEAPSEGILLGWFDIRVTEFHRFPKLTEAPRSRVG